MVRQFAKGLCVLGLVLASSARADFLPKNNLHLEDKQKANSSNVTKEQFEAIISKADKLYKDIVASHEGVLDIVGDWDDSEVNAGAVQSEGMWSVYMYGGLARRPEITPDGFAIVLCHELGHHLAGYSFSTSWASNEGQSDYFATHECALRMWEKDYAENAKFRRSAPEVVRQACDEVWSTTKRQDLCYRTIVAAKSTADLLATIESGTISFDTHDAKVVSKTFNGHPNAQCRLDTYMSGSVCIADFPQDVIPGIVDGVGVNSADSEQESARYVCTSQNSHGVRPACWFKSLL